MGCGFMFGEVVNYLRINQMKMLGLGRLFDTVRGGGGFWSDSNDYIHIN